MPTDYVVKHGDFLFFNHTVERVVSLSELHDLQSRLMLIAGEADKGKDDVTRFINVLSSAENLAKAYVQLKLSGCLLFNDWFADIR